MKNKENISVHEWWKGTTLANNETSRNEENFEEKKLCITDYLSCIK